MEIYDGASYRINIEGMDSTLMVDSYRGVIKAKIVDADDFIIVDHNSRTFYGTLVGDIVDEYGTVVVDKDNKIFNGNVSGNILDYTGNTVYDFIQNNLNLEDLTVNNFITGNLKGNIYNQEGFLFYDSLSNGIFIDHISTTTIDVRELNVVENVNGNFVGSFVGNIYDEYGDIILSSRNLTLRSNLVSEYNGISYDVETNTFYGNFVGELLTKNQNLDSITVGDNDIGVNGSIIIYSNIDLEDNHNVPLAVYSYKDSTNPSAIVLLRGRGESSNPAAVQNGDRLNSILFAAQLGPDLNDKQTVALLGSRVAQNGTVSLEGAPGEIYFSVRDYNNQLIEGFVIDPNGHTKTTIKDFSVVGNTNSAPVDQNNINSWLEVMVNGNKMFIPLYQ